MPQVPNPIVINLLAILTIAFEAADIDLVSIKGVAHSLASG